MKKIKSNLAVDGVVRILRRRIVRGDFQRGERLPARADLARDLESGLATVQVAVERLVQEGFLEVGARKLGTRVAEHPPHLSHYTVVFPFGEALLDGFWQALRQEVERTDRTDGRRLDCFYGLGGHRDIAAYQALVQAVQEERLAGLIFASSADELRGTPLLEHPGVPRAALADFNQMAPGVPSVCADSHDFLRRAVTELQRRECRRVAVLFDSREGRDGVRWFGRWTKVAESLGLAVDPCRMQFVDSQSPLAIRHCIKLLWRAPKSAQPDGLLIMNDTMVVEVAAALAEIGVPATGELPVVAMANFPQEPPTAVPVLRIGFDVPGILKRLIAGVDAVRNGTPYPDLQRLSALTAAEYHIQTDTQSD